MADNGYTQDYNTFEKKFTGDSNYANRKAVYDLFTKNGADLGGSYEEAKSDKASAATKDRIRQGTTERGATEMGRLWWCCDSNAE